MSSSAASSANLSAQAQQIFQSVDENSDGILSEEEVSKMLTKYNVVATAREVRLLFLQADKDANGLISQQEFALMMKGIEDLAATSSAESPLSVAVRKLIESRIAGGKESVSVFLGGSCNPTTWRKDISMPMLSQSSITYYNPQVDDWYPELMELERKAKDSCAVLLYSIDNQTRAIASMLEVAEFLGYSRRLVLALQDIKEGTPIQDSVIKGAELVELNSARQMVANLATLNQVEIFMDIESATRYTASLFQASAPIKFRDSIKPPSINAPDYLSQCERFFHECDTDKNNHIDARELSITFTHLGFHPTETELQTIFNSIDSNENQSIEVDEFKAFMIYLLEIRDPKSSVKSLKLKEAIKKIKDDLKAGSLDIQGLVNRVKEADQTSVNAYLGGSSRGKDWRAQDAIPFLSAKGISFFAPQLSDLFPSFSWVEHSVKERSDYLLYVISDDDRCIDSIVEAAYFIGKGRHVVLVVNKIPDGFKFGDHTVTPAELKDLNRARAYVSEAAKNAKLPVFDSLQAGLDYIASKAKH
eukprot:TRINITY_DN1750_c0_g1_i2.p1 TRINITY_DN1750_c0_g1~~TRINITY_DN1750_c0_g1_i2.p1  ORF type:complete len:532 (-),score=128.02 TRINITY_DN1750_c0_g1_i2:539-2134(-)